MIKRIIVGKRTRIRVFIGIENSQIVFPRKVSPTPTAIDCSKIDNKEARLNLTSRLRNDPCSLIFFVSLNVQKLLRRKLDTIAVSAPSPPPIESARIVGS